MGNISDHQGDRPLQLNGLTTSGHATGIRGSHMSGTSRQDGTVFDGPALTVEGIHPKATTQNTRCEPKAAEGYLSRVTAEASSKLKNDNPRAQIHCSN